MEAIVVQILSAVASALPKLIELFKHAGGRDAFLAALDSALIVARAQNDADLAAKQYP